MPAIVLTTLNARFSHTAFGLRYLYANLGELREKASIMEFVINDRPADIVEKLLIQQPEIVGFGVYIWNVETISATLTLLKQVAPDLIVVLGGPEVSHPPDLPEVAKLADYIITGAGEISFRQLCRQLLIGEKPDEKIIKSLAVDLDQLELPYDYYTDEDISQRVLYVEASRGCPFKCEFCLSALDVTATPFELEQFLNAMARLLERGARHFKFIDRTFNLKTATSLRILEFFRERYTDGLYLHFEVIPDNLPEQLKEIVQKFPAGALQFEIGVQTFDPAIQQLIQRRQNNQKTKENLLWLRQHSQVHIHADLIFGLPGDSLEKFGHSFDQLVELAPQEIQVGILKRLRGAPINRHTAAYQMKYNPNSPYNILVTKDIDFITMQRMNRFARYWDLIGNSGRFLTTLPYILGDQPFYRFLALSDGLYLLAGSTWKIALRRLFELIYLVLTKDFNLEADLVRGILLVDFNKSGEKGYPDFNQKSKLNQRRAVNNQRQRNYLAG